MVDSMLGVLWFVAGDCMDGVDGVDCRFVLTELAAPAASLLTDEALRWEVPPMSLSVERVPSCFEQPTNATAAIKYNSPFFILTLLENSLTQRRPFSTLS